MPVQSNPAVARAINILNQAAGLVAYADKLTNGYPAQAAFGSRQAIPAQTAAEFRASLVTASSEWAVQKFEAAVALLASPEPVTEAPAQPAADPAPAVTPDPVPAADPAPVADPAPEPVADPVPDAPQP